MSFCAFSSQQLRRLRYNLDWGNFFFRYIHSEFGKWGREGASCGLQKKAKDNDMPIQRGGDCEAVKWADTQSLCISWQFSTHWGSANPRLCVKFHRRIILPEIIQDYLGFMTWPMEFFPPTKPHAKKYIYYYSYKNISVKIKHIMVWAFTMW